MDMDGGRLNVRDDIMSACASRVNSTSNTPRLERADGPGRESMHLRGWAERWLGASQNL